MVCCSGTATGTDGRAGAAASPATVAVQAVSRAAKASESGRRDQEFTERVVMAEGSRSWTHRDPGGSRDRHAPAFHHAKVNRLRGGVDAVPQCRAGLDLSVVGRFTVAGIPTPQD